MTTDYLVAAPATRAVLPEALSDVSLRQLLSFRAVADEGSFHGAADALDYTQSAVSQHVMALEAALGAYARASEYAIAPVTTAAGYAMADLYRDFGRALLESERPRNLSARVQTAGSPDGEAIRRVRGVLSRRPRIAVNARSRPRCRRGHRD